MFARGGFLITIMVLSGLPAACGPGEREAGDDDSGGADAAVPDAAPFVDGQPLADAGPDFTVYVHTRDTLYTMDPTTFAVTMVGSFGTGDDLITDLAVGPDGTVYAISKTMLYTVNPGSGAATTVATLSSGPVAGNVGLTFLPDGQMLATDKSGGVRRIDPANGQVTEVGAFGGGFATAGDLVAVDDGTMYAISDEGPVGDEFTNNWLLTVNTATGAASPVGQIGFGQVFGAAFIGGKVLAFTKTGQVVEIDPQTGAGTLKSTQAIEFWGAGVTPLVPGVD
jgi:hypothetical protein